MTFAGFLADINDRGTPSIVEFIRSDNGTEFTKPGFVALLNGRGIRREYTPVISPKHDGVVERRMAMTLELAWRPAWRPPVCLAARRCCRRSPFGIRRVSTPAA